MASFRVADASEYLAITGWGIEDVKLAKKAWVFVGQQCKKFDITPVNYEFEVHAMSSEKLPFILPAVFTIGPKISEDGSHSASLLLYAKLIAPHDKNSSHVRELVKGVIEGETRVLAASMTMEQIFQGTKSFKQAVFENVQLELNQFGLYIYNANVKQLVDVPGQEYFSYLGQKTQQGAVNQAKVDVAEARMLGAVGAKEREGTTLQKAAEVDAQTKVFRVRQEAIGIKEQAKVEAEVKVFENEREAVVAAAKADLATKKAAWDRQTKVAEVEASKAVAIREAELQMEVEQKNALRLTEKLKAEQLSKATVQYDMQVPSGRLWSIFSFRELALRFSNLNSMLQFSVSENMHCDFRTNLHCDFRISQTIKRITSCGCCDGCRSKTLTPRSTAGRSRRRPSCTSSRRRRRPARRRRTRSSSSRSWPRTPSCTPSRRRQSPWPRWARRRRSTWRPCSRRWAATTTRCATT